MEKVLRGRDDRIREEMGYWLKVLEEREGKTRDIVRKELEEVLEKREARSQETDKEEVRTMLKEWGKEMEEMRAGQGEGG